MQSQKATPENFGLRSGNFLPTTDSKRPAEEKDDDQQLLYSQRSAELLQRVHNNILQNKCRKIPKTQNLEAETFKTTASPILQEEQFSGYSTKRNRDPAYHLRKKMKSCK